MIFFLLVKLIFLLLIGIILLLYTSLRHSLLGDLGSDTTAISNLIEIKV